MHDFSKFSISLCALLLLFLKASAETKIPAFPGAEGFGASSKGGRSGEVIYVTNLNDSGKGSLRWAVEKNYPRTIVFAVSGNIDLSKKLIIKHPFITLSGQTAPGDGICIRGETVDVQTHDVTIRHLRFRLGDGLHGIGSLQGKDALSISKGENIIIDHCSTSWSLDEILSASTRNPTLTNVTVQWCFITEALNPSNHGYGSLIRGTGGAKYSFHHNLYAHNQGRNPRPGNYDSNPHTEDPDGLLLDFRNNLIYNWGGKHAGYNADSVSVTHLNYVGNYLIPGHDSIDNGIAYSTGSPFNKAYFSDNFYDKEIPDNQWSLVHFKESWSPEEIKNYKQTLPFESGMISTDDPRTAFNRILKSGGATLPKRDTIDIRVIDHVKNRTGKIISSQNEVGGWVELNSSPTPTDSDSDGMPDTWETEHQLDPHDPEDRNQLSDSGYTMLEVYLNSL